jgi:hypothetical protein
LLAAKRTERVPTPYVHSERGGVFVRRKGDAVGAFTSKH